MHCEGSLKNSDVTFHENKVDRRKRVTVMVEKEGRQHVTKREREENRATHRNAPTTHFRGLNLV